MAGPSNFVSMLPDHLIEKEDNIVQEVDLQSIRKQIIEYCFEVNLSERRYFKMVRKLS